MKRYLIFIAVFILYLGSYAQNIKRPESYNYQRGMEAMQEEKIVEAIEFFNKDLKENPKNGYSFSWIAHLRLTREEYGKALTAADLAIKNLPKKDTEYVIFGYSTRAKCFLCLEDTIKALADYASAIKIKPDEVRLYDQRAQVYYELEQYDLADADYRKMVELQPGDVMGYMGLGRNANVQKHWDDAIKQFDYVTKLESEYSSGYAFRAESYIGLEKWNEATDDIISALSCDWDRKAVFLATNLKEPAFTMMISKMKVQSVKSPNEITWPYVMGLMYERNKQYRKAIEAYKESNKRNASPTNHQRIADCFVEMGEYKDALEEINMALNMDSTDFASMVKKADILYEYGDAKAAISEWDKIMNAQPDYAFGYYRRGWFKELIGDFDGGIEDLSMAIVLNPDFAYAYGTRGDLYQKLNKKELSEADFKKVIELENTPEKYECLHYAYQGLGQYDKAIEVMNVIIARDSTDKGSYYDAACLYSRMNNKEKALEYLRKSLELGYSRFSHMEKDQDLDLIRDTEEFKSLIQEFKRKEDGKETLNNSETDYIGSASYTEIPFTKQDGVCQVKCKINDLPLYFIFDTGASDVSMSTVEATFMMKNGYLTEKDVIGNQHYMDANGNVTVGTVVNLKNVNFGGFDLNNVRASIVKNQKAPLLLGQSVLGRLGKIEIDNSKNVIKISRNKSY